MAEAGGDWKPGGLKSDDIFFSWQEQFIKVAALDHCQLDAHFYRPGPLCSSRYPENGDKVFSAGGKKLGCDAEGSEQSWCLWPGEYGTVVEVDEDGDFRLRNGAGVESGFLLRGEFVYAELKEGEWKAATPSRFCVPLSRRPGERFGLHLDIASDGSGEVLNLCEGTIQGYNATAPDDQQVVPGCFVVSADKALQDKETMLEELTTKLDLRLLVAPRTTFTVEVAKASDMGLGLDLECGRHSKSVTVKGIRPGGVAEHNRRAEDLLQRQTSQFTVGWLAGRARSIPSMNMQEECDLRVGDRIEEVNGVRGAAEALLEQLRSSSVLRLVIARPSS